jgi:hypothetical protein
MNKEEHLIIYPQDLNGKEIVILIPMTASPLSLEQMQSKDVPSQSPSRIIPFIDIPDDHTFRNAWEADFENYQGVSVSMEKARLITQDLIREARRPVLEKLDIEYQRALEEDDRSKISQVIEKKQVLRDLPASPAIQEAKTPEELEHLARNSVKEAVGE